MEVIPATFGNDRFGMGGREYFGEVPHYYKPEPSLVAIEMVVNKTSLHILPDDFERISVQETSSIPPQNVQDKFKPLPENNEEKVYGMKAIKKYWGVSYSKAERLFKKYRLADGNKAKRKKGGRVYAYKKDLDYLAKKIRIVSDSNLQLLVMKP